MGRGRPKKRSPTTSEPLTLPVGAEAELRSADPGFLGSFYEVTVTGHLASSGRYTVVHSALAADDGGPLEETAAAADVRPRPLPPSARPTRGFAVHDAVEAFHNEGWWAGVVSAVPRPRVYEVAFPTSRETMEFRETALRPHRVFQAGRWVPAAELVLDNRSALFLEGTQVEVSRCAKSSGECWSPASVLKVIGATNFLVQYMHIQSDGKFATEILAAQYIRPVHTFRKCRFSQSSHVEVMHEDSWWPGVIRDVLGSGMNKKYVVKLKNYETGMEDVECVDVLMVKNTQLRPKFHWDGKKWLRCLEEKSANVPILASRKRPISSALSLHKEVGETSNKHGSYGEKKLKDTNVVSEPIPPLSSVSNESYEIKCMSSSYPKETVKQGNAVLAPSSPPAAGFSPLSDSSHALSSHLEQAPSRKITIPSAPVAAPQTRKLEDSLFKTFGRRRPLPQGPLLGVRSLSPHTPKEVIAAESIEEARNTVSMLEDMAKQKNGDNNIEQLQYNVTAGCGMLSETNTVTCVDPTTTPPKDIGGSQHAASQQDRGSAMDDRLSESLATQHLPFGKTSQVWARIEAMEIFSEMPQRPTLNQFQLHGPELREGMELGMMISFANLAESIDRLDVHQEDIVQDKKQGLSFLEENGFDVRALRSRLEAPHRAAR